MSNFSGSHHSSTLFFFLFIFLIGGYIRLHRPSSRWLCWAGWFFVLVCLALTLANTVNQILFHSTPFLQIRGLANNSIPIFTSVCLFQWFSALPVKESKLGSFAVRVSPYILSVYLIHDNLFVRPVLWDELVCPTQFISEWYFIPYVMMVCAVILLLCILIDMWRKYLTGYLYFFNPSSLTKRFFSDCQMKRKLP